MEASMRVTVRVLGVAAVALLLAVGASAQLSKGFRGRVLDKDGKPVVGVIVNLQDQSNAGNHYDVKTDEQGYYIQIGIPYSDKGYIIKTQPAGMPEMGMIMKAKLMDTLELVFDPRKCVGVLGTVKDKQGQMVPNATVNIVNLANETQPYTVKTDSKGAFRKGELPYSDKGYRITVQIPGEQPLTRNFSMPAQMIGQPDREPSGERPTFQIAFLDLSFDFANPSQSGGSGGAAAASLASDAQQMFEMGDYEGAVGKAGEAISANDNVKGAMLIRATALERLDRDEEALAAFEAYNKAYPGDVNVLGELYKLSDKRGDKTKAEAYKKEFVAKGGQISGVNYNDGVKALNEGNAAKAAEFFKQAIKENAGDPDAHRELARCYAQTGNFQGTIDELNIYLKMKPNADDAETWKQAIVGLQQAIQQQHKK
jgi:tetratricopeptide (TPR) repeat protein